MLFLACLSVNIPCDVDIIAIPNPFNTFGTFLKALKIAEERRNKILQSMIDDGLIDGFTRVNYAGGYGFKALEPRLTIKGMEFLQEIWQCKK